MEKQKIKLTQEKETLLVPLYGKAMASQRPHPVIVDPKAAEILEGIEYDFRELMIPQKTSLMMAMRAGKLDSLVQDYLDRTPDPVVLHLGCGLDSRVLRVKPEKGEWYDLDFPEVIELCKNFYDETDHYHMISSSVTDHSWLEQVKGHGPAYIVAEGLLMYLREGEVKQLFIALQQRLPSSEISFDAYSRLTARSANNHPSIKKTGARLHWGLDDFAEIKDWGIGLHLMEEWYFSSSKDIPYLGFWDRFMFRTMGAFRAANIAHRILHVRL